MARPWCDTTLVMCYLAYSLRCFYFPPATIASVCILALLKHLWQNHTSKAKAFQMGWFQITHETNRCRPLLVCYIGLHLVGINTWYQGLYQTGMGDLRQYEPYWVLGYALLPLPSDNENDVKKKELIFWKLSSIRLKILNDVILYVVWIKF
jgi:hypothetical protein